MLPPFRSSMLAGGKKKPAYWGLCFTALTPGSTVALMKNSATNTIYLQTSFDGKVWTPYADNQVITLAKAGDCVYFAAQDGRINQRMGNTGTSASNARTFSMTGKIAASGMINSLQDNTGSLTRAYSYGFKFLFRRCSSLVSAPALPATTLAEYCYLRMFQGSSLVVSAPALPATTLAKYCYQHMFQGCDFVSAPALPATTLAEYCYDGMFTNCRSLAYVDVKFSAFSGTGTNTWLSSVASTGVFRCPAALGTNETIQRGPSYCPAGWTVENI